MDNTTTWEEIFEIISDLINDCDSKGNFETGDILLDLMGKIKEMIGYDD